MGNFATIQTKSFKEINKRLMTNRVNFLVKSPDYIKNQFYIKILIFGVFANLFFSNRLEIKEKQLYYMYIDYQKQKYLFDEERGNNSNFV